MPDSHHMSFPTLSEFYANKTVAITGATGFLGQCVVEKILRNCPQVKSVLILLRNKNNVSVDERLNSLCALPIFDKLRSMQPEFQEKIQPIYCNLEENNLDLSREAVNLIQNNVNIFIHCAATLRFDQHLRLAFYLNSRSVLSVVKLCKGIKNLLSLVHVSTAYSYCNQKIIDEEVYSTGWDYDKLSNAMEWMTDEMITKVTPDILGDRPNTYTLTKAIGEEVIVNEGDGLPICIVRPSIIGACLDEPLPGWCSNLNGATGIIVALGKGLLHSLCMNRNLNIDIIPADFVVNTVVAAAWRTGVSHQRKKAAPELSLLTEISDQESEFDIAQSRRKSIPIYQAVVGEKNPLRARHWGKLLEESFFAYPFDKVILAPSLYFVPNKFIYRIQSFVMQYLPAYIFDKGMSVFGQKPTLLRYNQLLAENVNILDFFITSQWIWKSKSIFELHHEMCEEDKKNFNPIAYTTDWPKYVENYAIGTKKYIVKEDTQSYSLARRRLWKIRMIGYLLQGFLLMITWRLLVSQTSSARNLWHLCMSLLFKFLNFVSSFKLSLR